MKLRRSTSLALAAGFAGPVAALAGLAQAPPAAAAPGDCTAVTPSVVEDTGVKGVRYGLSNADDCDGVADSACLQQSVNGDTGWEDVEDARGCFVATGGKESEFVPCEYEGQKYFRTHLSGPNGFKSYSTATLVQGTFKEASGFNCTVVEPPPPAT